MMTSIIPKLPMKDKAMTKNFYINQMKFEELGDYGDYLMVSKENIEIHFFEYKDLNPHENYGQVYIRTDDIESLYKKLIDDGIIIHTNGNLQIKPWGQKEFAILDPDNNLLTYGQSI